MTGKIKGISPDRRERTPVRLRDGMEWMKTPDGVLSTLAETLGWSLETAREALPEIPRSNHANTGLVAEWRKRSMVEDIVKKMAGEEGLRRLEKVRIENFKRNIGPHFTRTFNRVMEDLMEDQSQYEGKTETLGLVLEIEKAAGEIEASLGFMEILCARLAPLLSKGKPPQDSEKESDQSGKSMVESSLSTLSERAGLLTRLIVDLNSRLR